MRYNKNMRQRAAGNIHQYHTHTQIITIEITMVQRFKRGNIWKENTPTHNRDTPDTEQMNIMMRRDI